MLDVDEMIANLLVFEGFSSLEEVAFVPFEEIATIDGFDEDTAKPCRAQGAGCRAQGAGRRAQGAGYTGYIGIEY